MKTTDDNFISDAHFDVLLRHALLKNEQSFTAQTLETMANNAFMLVNVKDISETNSERMIEKLTADFKSGRSRFRLNVFLLSLFAILTIGFVIFFTSGKKEITAKINSVPVVIKDNTKFEPIPTIMMDEINGNPLPRTNPAVLAFVDSAREDENLPAQTIIPTQSIPTRLYIPVDHDFAYEDIPVLNDDQKKQTAKDKLKILKEVGKKKLYSTLPAGATNVNGVLTQVNAFGIKDAEITNFEYRTFLNDLLTKGKFEDYLLAKPVAGGWKALGIGEFENVYFENEKYNSFPVVNITRKGAELYCNWMTSSMKEAITNKDVKWSGTAMPDFRLPTNVEWIYAARACDTTIQTPWEKYTHNILQNNIGCYLCNFNYSASKNKVAPEGPQLYRNNTKGCISAKMSTRAVVTTAGRSIDTLVVAPVFSYNPNNSGLYCTVGNASEMVWAKNATGEFNEARSMGGSWYSDWDNTKIEAPEQYVGVTDARAYIGFRIVMTSK